MVRRRSQKRKAMSDDNCSVGENGETFISPPRQKDSLAVFEFKSPSSDPSIEENSPSIPSISFYKATPIQKRNILAATENVSRTNNKADSPNPSKRLRPSYLSKEAIMNITKSPALLIPRNQSKGVKDWSPIRGDDVISASTPGNTKKSSCLTDIKDIVSAVTSDSPVRKTGSDSSDSENDDSIEIAKKQPRKELFSAGLIPVGKYNNKFYSKVLSPKKHALTPDVIPGKRFFKHRKCLSECKPGKGANISVGKGFCLKFTPHGQKENAKKNTRKNSSAKKANANTNRKSRFSKLEFTSDITKNGKELVRVTCATADNVEEKGAPVKTTDLTVVETVSVGNSAKKSEDKVVKVDVNSNACEMPSQSESVPASQCSMELFSNTSSNPIDQILEGFGFDEEDAVCSVASPSVKKEVSTRRVADEETEAKLPSEEVDDGWSTQSVASSSDMTVSSKADSNNGQDVTDGTPSQKKLFPIFTRSPKQMPKSETKHGSVKKSSPRTVRNRLEKNNGLEQYTLDFGQKPLGTTQCGTCGMVYMMKEPTDEAHHAKFHQRMLTALKFPKVKKELVVQEFPNGSCIIKITPDDKFAQKKVDAILSMVDEDLGFLEVVPRAMDHKKTFLFISEQKKVIGCCVAEAITMAYPVLTDSQRSTQLTNSNQQRAWCCSTESVPAKCGVSRIWVFRNERRKGVATQLLDCVRYNFFLGNPLEKSELAFTDPTTDGRSFATNFSGIPNFLVYK